MQSDERILSRTHLFPVPSIDVDPEITVRSSRPPEEERTLVDLYRPEPTYEVQVVTSPEGLPIVSVRPTSRRESTWSQTLRRRRGPGDETRLAVRGLVRSLRWSAARAWVLAFGLGGSAMAGAVAVLFFAGLLPGHEMRPSGDRSTPMRPAVADEASVLTLSESLVGFGADSTASARVPERVVDSPPRRPRRRSVARANRQSVPNPFVGAIPIRAAGTRGAVAETSSPSSGLAMSESADF